MDDDETVMSAYAFIETVAAIVVQTAARQFLAFLKVESLRFTRESKILESRILSIERAASEQADRASQGECEVVRRIGIREPLVYDQYQMKNILNDTSISNDFRVIEASEISECDIDDMAMNLYHLAAVQIQAVYRGFWIRDCLDVDHYCTTVLQRTYRGFKCRKMVQRDVKNIILVQSWWRRNIARDDAANILAYVIVLQAVYRGHRVRKRYKIHEEKVANYKAKWAAATIIQWIWRGYNVRKLYENYRDGESTMERAAATAIQSRWRAFVCEAYFIRTLVDVLIVQTVVRRWLAHGTTTARRQLQASTLVFDDVEKAGNMPSRRQNKEPLLVNDKESVAIHENTYSKPVDVPTIPQRLSTIQKQCSKIESYHSPRAQVNDQNQTGEDASHLVHNKSHSSAAPTNRQKEGTASAMGEVRARGLLSSVADPPGHVVKRSRFVSDYEMEPCRQVLRVNEMKASKAVAYPMNDDLDDLSRSLVVDVDTIRLIGASSKLNDVNQKDEQSKQHTKENLSMGVQSTSPQTRYFESDSMSASQSDAPSVGTTSNLLSIWKEKEKRNVIIEKSTVEHCLR